MPIELDLPSTQDGTGFLKSAVIEHIIHVRQEHSKLVAMAQETLDDAQEQRRRIISEAKTDAETLLGEAVAQKSVLDQEIAERMQEVDRYVRRKSNEASARTTEIIERAMSKVHALVKTAQESLVEAENTASQREVASLQEFSDTVSHAGTMLREAEEHVALLRQEATSEAESIRLRAETYLTYAHQEAQNIEAEAKARAQEIVDVANDHEDKVRAWSEAHVADTVTTMEQFKAFYLDTVNRLSALYQTGLSVTEQLAHADFPEPGDTKMLDFPQRDDQGYIRDDLAENKEDYTSSEVAALVEDLGLELDDLEQSADTEDSGYGEDLTVADNDPDPASDLTHSEYSGGGTASNAEGSGEIIYDSFQDIQASDTKQAVAKPEAVVDDSMLIYLDEPEDKTTS